MHPDLSHNETITIDPEIERDLHFNEDFAPLLRSYGLTYNEEGIYYSVGNQSPNNWVIDIPVIVTQLRSCLDRILPELKQNRWAFSIPQNAEIASNLLGNEYGYLKLGKVIVVYPQNAAEAGIAAQLLVNLTLDLRGPDVPTDTNLGGLVYVHFDQQLNVPFSYPNGESWPFPFPLPKKNRLKRILNKRFIPIQIIKSDIKGNVLKAIYLKKWWQLQFELCIIKEGKKEMSLDGADRTIKDRLEWQILVHKLLATELPIPKVLGYFELKGNHFFAMQYIEGIQIHDYLHARFSNRTWQALPLVVKEEVLAHLCQVIELVMAFHSKGFIHRDITPPNFILDASGKIYLIDLELCYHPGLFGRKPPYTFGTPGFMSPEQENMQKPTIEQDVYAIGAVIICFLTGLNPYKFSVEDKNLLFNNLYFFIGDEEICHLILECTSKDKKERPSMEMVNQKVLKYRHRIRNINSPVQSTTLGKEAIEKIIQKHINAYKTGILAAENMIWFSRPQSHYHYVANPSSETGEHTGFYSGIAGVLFVMARAVRENLSLSAIDNEVKENIEYLIQQPQNKTSIPTPGLYLGTNGTAVALSESIKSRLIIADVALIELIGKNLERVPSNFEIGNGLAGYGLSLMACRDLLDPDWVATSLSICFKKITEGQENDGSWIATNPKYPGIKLKLAGFSHGAAGVIYFLLKYYAFCGNESALKPAIKGLGWLQSAAANIHGIATWTISDKTKLSDPFVDIGDAGIAYVFIRAYEVLGSKIYKQIATTVLTGINPSLLSPNNSLMTGNAGIGMVYLHAYRVFKEIEWKNRAEHIAQVYCHSFVQGSKLDFIYWLTVNSNLPTADFMSGNSGIWYFLLNYLRPQNIIDNLLI
ncbi:protein kinase [Chitinophaga sp. CC14]|uniref:lanthionine synthetase LanC family protein n=1 Tax=Chitinophaga sp. CC14 TaxID=3029199 RepID=UPI003B791A42